MAPERRPRVGVVVVTYNSADVLPACLASIRDGGADGVDLTDLVVVDNASDDGSPALAEATPGLPVSVVRLGCNGGYAAGLNAGVDTLRPRAPEAVVVLNPDCRLRPGAIGVLARCLHEPGRGIVAPRLVNPDGSLQPTLRRRPTISGALVEALLGGRVADRVGLGELVFDADLHARPGRASWVTGAALLISWDALASVGPWDESFLLYSEETEYMLRAADHGWSTWYEPTAVVEHRGGESDVRPDLAALLVANKVALFRQCHGPAKAFVYRAAILAGMLVRASTGTRTARASVAALVLPSRRISALSELS